MSVSRTVLVFGTFDPLHEGHLSYFKQARLQGDRLVCVVARDVTVKRVKGAKPMYSEQERFAAVGSCGLVDQVALGSTKNVYDVLGVFEPDVICLGYDQHAFTGTLTTELKRRGLSCDIVRLKAYKPEEFKSSIIKAKAL
ncbi:MAG: adenylyltransferase/cytidyltransferase family protein [Candidatus Doudnabacteria bacterium]|nr:adenylyltransferase/cytidyltransferase family protein [Candidatus Doudnabacteria bacterium]